MSKRAPPAYAEDYHLSEGEDEEEADVEDVDEQYYDSYGVDITVTKVMLSDAPRMRFYDEAIRAAGVSGKIVVDVGAGTGVLSMMAARAGARKVIAVEASAMAVTATHVIRANGYARTVRVLNRRAEEVTRELLVKEGFLEEGETVDFIVSEWMGFYLLHENMLPSVLAVRDALGCNQLIPSSATIMAAPVDLTPHFEAQTRPFWKDCGGFDLSVVGAIEEAGLQSANPMVVQLVPASLLSEPQTVWTFDLGTITVREFTQLRSDIDVVWSRSDLARSAVAARRGNATVWGLALWFTVFGPQGTAMPSGPADPPTHWKQSVVLLSEELRGGIAVQSLIKDGDTMRFSLQLDLNVATRSYVISLSLSDPNE